MVQHFAVNTKHPEKPRIFEVVDPDGGPDGAGLDIAEEHSLLFAANVERLERPTRLLLRRSRVAAKGYERVAYAQCERFRWDYWERVCERRTLTIY